MENEHKLYRQSWRMNINSTGSHGE